MANSNTWRQQYRLLEDQPWSKEKERTYHLIAVRESAEHRAHHARFERFVLKRHPRLSCQECHGEGGWTDVIDPELGGPYYECGYCEGTGYVTPHLRGEWLRYKREEARERKSALPCP